MKLPRPILTFLTVVLLAAAAAPGLSALQQGLSAMRVREGLAETAAVEDAPPAVAFTTAALGGFRGLLADVLWLRSVQLQDEGRYFEMFQLASWIAQLQPRHAGAISHLGWNMGYNISVTFSDPEDRWRWVQRGISLLRDEGLRNNPTDPGLHETLAWFYLHKLGAELDDAHQYYKRQFARRMTAILGAAPDWEALARAPDTPDALRNALPPDAVFWKRLADLHLDFDAAEKAFRHNNGALPDELQGAALPDAERDALTLCLRRRWLQQECRLEPGRILALNRKYGPLDWRHPLSHAIYWSSRGLDVAPGHRHHTCELYLRQSLKLAFDAGRILGDPEAGTMQVTSNLDLANAVDRMLLDGIAADPADSAVKTAHANFLADAVTQLYLFGRREAAARLLAEARRLYGERERRFRRPLGEFAIAGVASSLDGATADQALSMIQGYLWQACYMTALGDNERAAGYDLLAAKLWQTYMEKLPPAAEQRRRLPPLDSIRSKAVQACLANFHPALAERLRRELKQKPAPSADSATPREK
jgi:hypothetical protein